MSDDNKSSISADEVKQKLSKLEELIPDADNDHLYEFGRFLSNYIDPNLAPMRFVIDCELAIHDLQKGVCNFVSKTIPCKLCGLSSIFYNDIRSKISSIADVVFPSDFAAEVKEHIKKIETKISGEKKTK